jgi:hypothetical protein
MIKSNAHFKMTHIKHALLMNEKAGRLLRLLSL